MTTSVLKVTSNERVDLADFLYAVDESLRAQSRQHFDQFFSDPARAVRSWVVNGFEATGAGSATVTVTRGRAVFAHREVGQVYYGALTTEGELTRIVDISGFANGTYGVYLRFDLIDGESLSRAYWNPAGLGSEIAQTTPTRRLANWSVRVELTLPGAEWTKVADIAIAGGLISTVTDRRNFFFEGEVDQAYRSGWSTDGGGGANDRSATRKTYGAHDLHTFLAATRQCLEDIRGRGLRRWWDRDIGGMNIGFDAAPAEDRLAIGDVNFNLQLSGGYPYFYFDAATQDFMYYHRGANTWLWQIANTTVYSLAADLASFYADANIRTGGMAVGYVATSAQINDDEITVGDSDFGLSWNLTAPTIYFDRTDVDRLYYDRTGDVFKFIIATNAIFDVTTTGIRSWNGAVVGHSGTPIDDTLSVVDADFYLTFVGGSPTVGFAPNDRIRYVRATDTHGEFQHTINSVNRLLVRGATAPYIRQYGGTRYQYLDSVLSAVGTGETFNINTGAGSPQLYTPGAVIPANTAQVGDVIKVRMGWRVDRLATADFLVGAYIGVRASIGHLDNLGNFTYLTPAGATQLLDLMVFVDIVGVVRDNSATGKIAVTSHGSLMDFNTKTLRETDVWFQERAVDFTTAQEIIPGAAVSGAGPIDVRLEWVVMEIQ